MKPNYLVEKIEPAFIDERGVITDLINRPISHVGIITTRRGKVRASHYHKKSHQYSYITKGAFEVTLASKRTPENISRVILKRGEMISIAPGTIHRFRAIANADMVDMISQSRSGNSFEADVVRVTFVKRTFVIPSKKNSAERGQ